MIQATRTAFVEQPDGSIQCIVTIHRIDRAAAMSGEAIELSPIPGYIGADPGGLDDQTVTSIIERSGVRELQRRDLDKSIKMPTSEEMREAIRSARYKFDEAEHGIVGIEPRLPSTHGQRMHGEALTMHDEAIRRGNEVANDMASRAMHAIDTGKQAHAPVIVCGEHGLYATHESPDFDVALEAEPAADRPPAQTVGVGGFDSAQVVEAVTSGEYTWDHPAAPHMANIFRHPPFQRFAMYRLAADKFAAPMECATRLIMRAVKDKPMDAAVAGLTARMDEYMAWAASNNLPVWPEHR